MFTITKKTVDIAATGASLRHHHDRSGAKTQEVFEVKLNENFAHASEEAQKAGLFMAVAAQLGDGRTKADRTLQGLMLVADAIRYSDAQTYLNTDSHVYAGSRAGLEKWKSALGTDVLQELEEIVVED